MKSKIPLGLCVPIMFTLMSTAQPSQSPGVAAVVATVEVATEMEAAPTDCGPSPEAIEINKKYYGPVLGTWPIWGTIYAGQSHIGVLAMPHDHPTSSWLRDWWGQKVLWLVSTSYKGKVKLSGFNSADHGPIYFSFNGNAPVTIAILDPASPGAFAEGSDQFANFPSGVYVSKAGCYTLEAQWDGGLWRQTIAVGYVKGFKPL